MNPRAKDEYEQAYNSVINEYNTAIYENRFIVGGAIEIFTYALLRHVGINCELIGEQATRGDIRLLPSEKLISLKSSTQVSKSGKPSNIILINTLSKNPQQWKVSTFFIISTIGIVFGTPTMIDENDLKYNKDNISIKGVGLEKLKNNSDNVISLNLKRKEKLNSDFHKTASSSVAKDILNSIDSQVLSKFIAYKDIEHYLFQ